MAKKNYPTRVMSPVVTTNPGPHLVIAATRPTTCADCGHFFDPEEDAKAGLHGECRLNPPNHVSEYLTRRGTIRRYALVLATTPSCGGYRPR